LTRSGSRQRDRPRLIDRRKWIKTDIGDGQKFVHEFGLAFRIGLPASPISLPMGRADIGDYLGLTLETVSRTMSRLRREGIIAGAPTDSVELIDREQLEEISATY
jgi:CRP-like cAMP-binding protein